MNQKELDSWNEIIWEQKKWGNEKLAKLMEEELEEELK